MRNGDGGPALGQLLQGSGHHVFAFIVKGRGCFIQDQDSRVLKENPGNTDALLLSSRQLDAAFTHIGVISILKLRNEIMGAGQPGCFHHFLPGCPGPSITDILKNRP